MYKGSVVAASVLRVAKSKTTLMRVIVDIQKPSSRLFAILYKVASSASVRPRAGYVIQAFAVYPNLVIWQNISYFDTLMQASKVDITRAIDAAHPKYRVKQIMETLSVSQKTRASSTIMLAGSADVLVLDDLNDSLNPVLREDFWQLFHDLATSVKMLITSSHVMGVQQLLVEMAFIAKVKENR